MSEKIDIGTGDTFYVADNGNFFGIAFDKLFRQPKLNIYNLFEMTSKRNFKNLSPAIYETYIELFLNGDSLKEEAEYIFFNLLKVKSTIMVEESVSYDQFIQYIDEIACSGDVTLLSIIDKYVEDNYALELDSETAKTKQSKRKVNTELQFTDSAAKILLKISYLYRVMIPIISVYFYYNKNNFSKSDNTTFVFSDEDVDELQIDDANSKIFAYLFEKFADNPEALRNKLYKLTYSGVSKTAYSDKRFWLAAKNVGITEKTEALEIYKKILTNAIPKLSLSEDKNVISFLQSVINNQVDFLFQNKFKYHYIPLGMTDLSMSTDDDDSSVNEFERMQLQKQRKDEGEKVIMELNIKNTLKKIPEKMNVGVSDAEVKDMLGKITRNAIQEEIISMLTFKYFNDKNALKYLSFYEYCYLLIACKKFLLTQKFIYLPEILTAKCEKHRERINISGKKVRPEILNSKKYKDLLEKKYPNFNEEIEKPFLAFIGTVYSSVFKDNDGNELFNSAVKVGKIAEEIVDLAAFI